MLSLTKQNTSSGTSPVASERHSAALTFKGTWFTLLGLRTAECLELFWSNEVRVKRSSSCCLAAKKIKGHGFSFLVMHRRIKCTLTVSRFQKHSQMLLHKAINQIYINTEMVKDINISFKAAFVIIKGKSFCSSTAGNTNVMGSILWKCTLKWLLKWTLLMHCESLLMKVSHKCK